MLLLTVLLTLGSAVTVSAFTNGSLVPAYICNPTPDGLPKNYGEVLSFTRKQVRKLAFNANRMCILLSFIVLLVEDQTFLSIIYYFFHTPALNIYHSHHPSWPR